MASYWLNRDITLPLTGMNEFIQATPGLKTGIDRPIVVDFGGGSGSMEMVKVAINFDKSRLFLLYSLSMVIQRCLFPPNRDK